MSLENVQKNAYRCLRCSNCKWVPGAHVKSWRFAEICPSIFRYNFHAYSGGGKVITAASIISGRTELTDEVVDIIYKCQLCGGCDIACRPSMGGFVEPLDVIRELRIKAVGEGFLIPEHMMVIEGLKNEDNMMQKPKEERGDWAEGLDVKNLSQEKAEVVLHAGCLASFDPDLRNIIRGAAALLKEGGIDFGIFGKDEACCGGRAYSMGYMGEFTKFAEHNLEAWKKAGAKKVVLICADGFGALRNLYPKVIKEMDIEVLHISQYLDELIKEGKIKFSKKIPMKVTYHDPCNLGRLGEAYPSWKGVEKKLPGPIVEFDPPKPERYGVNGVYDPPRDILNSIPGIELIEMERIREHSWCCGAGGGVIDAFQDFALSTAKERIEEAKSTGAEAIASSCQWCIRTLRDAMKEHGD
ncbi:MAG: (Fe-S)-binding protein, partial [Deltaproteobacteria bacterium]|nr:(Fe-S)-binding protein [Deltaproteobacteria bacterium]